MDVFFFYFFNDFEKVCNKLISKYFDVVEIDKELEVHDKIVKVDIYAENEDRLSSVFEIKYYNSDNIDYNLLGNACRQLSILGMTLNVDNYYLVSNLRIDDYLKDEMFNEYNVVIIDVENLLFLAKEFPDIKSDLIDILNVKSNNTYSFEEKEFSFKDHFFSRVKDEGYIVSASKDGV